MILGRYIFRHIAQGTFLTLLIVVSIGLLGIFIGELSDIGRGYYSLLSVVEYVALSIPAQMVAFMPLAVLIGTILGLGALASNREIIAMQAAGFSIVDLLRSVILSAMILALLAFLVAEIIVPVSETSAHQMRLAAISNTPAFGGRKGIWIKDTNQVIHIDSLRKKGYAQGVKIYQLDQNGKLSQALIADAAIYINGQWRLEKVQVIKFGAGSVQTENFDEVIYDGAISNKQLDALLISPRQMSSLGLYEYRIFLAENNLDNSVESLIFWQKIFAPLTVVVMCFLAVPFALGSQREGNTGQRLIVGILLGLAYNFARQLLTSLGTLINSPPVLNALAPSLLFFMLTLYLLYRKNRSS